VKLETWGGGLLFVRWIVLLRLSYLIIFILKNDRSLVNAFLLLPSVLNIKVWCVLFLRTMSSNVLFLSAAVGTLLGALTGALIGQETESGFIRGAAVGAISGAVFSIEVFESSLVLWQSDESGIGCVLYLVSYSPFRMQFSRCF